MKIVDLKGNVVDDNAEFIASRDNRDGTITAFFIEDVEELMTQMGAEKAVENVPEAEFWANNACARQAARNCSKGSCPPGKSCTLIDSGNFSYCRCR